MPNKMRAFLTPMRYKFAYGGRGSGKSESIAKMLLYMADQKKIKILCTREYQNSIKDSVHSLLSDLISELNYTDYIITANGIENIKTHSQFIFMGLQQQDKKQTLKSLANCDICWIEEAQSISEGSLKILDPTIRKEDSEIWASFNRLFPDDPIWKFQERVGNKIVVFANYYDNPFLPKTLQEQSARDKTEYEDGVSDDYLHIWLGEPIGFSEKTLFKLKDVVDAINREVSNEGVYEVGVDVARFGKDKTVLFKRKGLQLIDYKVYNRTSIDEVCQYVVDFVGGDKTIKIKIDDTGLGGGVTDFLNKWQYNAVGVNNGSSAKDSDKYGNAISEMWFELKGIIDQVQLLDIPELKSDLITREWTIDNKGRRCIESKKLYKKRGNKSPDFADALLLCYYNKGSEYAFYTANVF